DSLVIGLGVGDAEVVFTALPAGEAAKQAAGWIRDGRTVIDIGSDFRLRDPMLYERWYGYAHPAPDLLKEAVYGLTELTRDRVRTARLIANPGCYPTAALLALAPALKAVLDTYPATKATLGSNWCLVHALVDEENARLVAFAALDNLVKGAAGSALQNFNARFGYPETMGLEALPLWP